MIKLNSKYRREMTDSSTIWMYITAGRGIVTLEAPSGKSHTYAFLKPVNASEFPDDVIFVYAVHEEKQLFYIGMIEGKFFRLTRHSRFLSDTEIVKGANYIMKMASNPKLHTPMKLYHEGICCRCGRPLTSEKSLQSGIGHTCYREYMF